MTLAAVIDLAARRRAVEDLVREHRAWALSLARAASRGRHGNWAYDDLESAALEALWRTARRWNGHGTFQGFAYLPVRNAVIDRLRQVTHYRRSAGQRWADFVSLEHCADVASPEPDDDIDLAALIARTRLTPRQREAVTRRLAGESAESIAAEWSVSPNAIYQFVHVAAAKLRETARSA